MFADYASSIRTNEADKIVILYKKNKNFYVIRDKDTDRVRRIIGLV